MKVKVITLVLATLAICLAVFTVSLTTADKTRYHNDFIRIFPSHAADIHKAINFGNQISPIAGFGNEALYVRLGNRVLALSTDVLDTCNIGIEVPSSSALIVTDSVFYIHDGTRSEVQIGNTQSWNIDTVYQASHHLLAIQPISEKSFVLQFIDKSIRKSVFTKSTSPEIKKDVLTKQVDGIICTDGFLQYSPGENILVYTYRYRNQFLCLDTNLNVLHIGTTIDTTSVARIEVSEVDGAIRMSTPPFVVNKSISVDGRHLFINSTLVARNESPDEVANRNVIDVYNILDGSYRYSFYVHDQDNIKMRSFKVRDSTLYAVFPNKIVRYDLASRYLKN